MSDEQRDKQAAGQRRINVVWEVTQSVIALMVTSTAMYTGSKLSMTIDMSDDGKSVAATAFLLISNTAMLVIGFYFGRTNHSRSGGIHETR